MNWQEKINFNLNIRQATNSLRIRTVVQHGAGPYLIHEQRRYLNFSSNDYLGLSQHPAIIHSWQQGIKQFGAGSGGSGHINGYTVAHLQLEEKLAQWLDYPRALLFISGFAANQAVIITLASKQDHIIADKLSHASILEASYLSTAQLRRFAHNNIMSLEKLLSNTCNGQKLVITEGIFSMDGDKAPLSSINTIVKHHNAWLMVDDAHGIGLVGCNGQGSCAAHNIKPELLIISFSKSIGISGAAVLCNDEIAQYLVQFSRHLIYSTSMPPAQAMALQTAIDIICSDEGEHLRSRLKQYINIFREGAKQFEHWQLTESYSAIQPLIIGNNIDAIYLTKCLKDIGIWTTAIRPPTVPVGTSRLRLILTAAHKQQDITALLEALHNVSR